MNSVTKSPLDNEMIPCYSTISWDDIPTEIYFYIFKKLDITSLRCCFTVSRKWREIATYICEEQDFWQALAEDGMVNHGVAQKLKSTLNWKDLYFNSLLWSQLPSAAAHKLHEVEKRDIRNMHVYRDKAIVVNTCGVEYYDIESFQTIRFIPTTFCVDVQESDDIMLVVTDMYSDRRYNRVTVFLKLHKDEKVNVDDYLNSLIMAGERSIHAFVDAWYWRLFGNRVYVIDSRSVLWECCAKSNTLSVKALAKYYGQIPRRSSTIHVIDEDVYVPLKLGRLVMVTKNSKMFRVVNTLEIPTKIVEGCNSNTGMPLGETIDTFSAFTKFPFGVHFIDKKLTPLRMIHYHYDDPKMTCGLQHGDVVFRGFVDGEITINLLRDGFKFNLNVQQFDHDEVKEPFVTAIDICEIKGMHKLFVATKHKLYFVVLTYPNDEETTEIRRYTS